MLYWFIAYDIFFYLINIAYDIFGDAIRCSIQSHFCVEFYLGKDGEEILWLEETLSIQGRETYSLEEHAFESANILSLFLLYSQICC